MIRVLVVDDHGVVREGLKRIIAGAGDMAVAADAATAAEALAAVRRLACNVVVTDLSLPGRSGLDLLRELRRERPRLPVLVLTVHAEDHLAMQALKLGASGYLTKECAPEELVLAIRKVHGGGRYLGAAVVEALASRLGRPDEPSHERLSEREYAVLVKLALGRTITEIAGELALSAKTVSTYKARLLAKMGLRRDAELVAYAVRHRLIDNPL